MSINKHRGSTLASISEEAVGAIAVAKLTARGGVTIPKAMRDKHGWSAGIKLRLSEENAVVFLIEAGKQVD